MQQYFQSDFENDPSRNIPTEENDNTKNDNIFTRIINSNMVNDNTPDNTNDNNDKPILRDSIHFNSIDQTYILRDEILDRDKKNQELTFKMTQLEIKNRELLDKLKVIDEYKAENKILLDKLNIEYEKNKEE